MVLVSSFSFDEFGSLYCDGAYHKAYEVLRGIMAREARYREMGDLYVFCADLELATNGDLDKARKFLEKAMQLGCTAMAG